MPRQARIDAPGALHHIIARGIGRRKLFDDDVDRNVFLDRLGTILNDTETACFAWTLIPNHFHLLLRTGQMPISTVMRRLLTGYAMGYNRRHKRSGHLFQNRFKSILCQEEPYFLELVRYIHLNPLRAKIVHDLKSLDNYRYAGHSVVMDKHTNDWQKVGSVLLRYAKQTTTARKKYRQFVEKGLAMGKRPELTRGGLVRSMGGWSEVKALRRAKTYMKGDERILGDSDFVQRLMEHTKEAYERRYKLKARGVDLDSITRRVSELLDISMKEIWSNGKYRHIVAARSLLCYWAVNELDMSLSKLAQKFEVSPTTISQSVLRGKALVQEYDYKLEGI